jgi:hypothetical protein
MRGANLLCYLFLLFCLSPLCHVLYILHPSYPLKLQEIQDCQVLAHHVTLLLNLQNDTLSEQNSNYKTTLSHGWREQLSVKHNGHDASTLLEGTSDESSRCLAFPSAPATIPTGVRIQLF